MLSEGSQLGKRRPAELNIATSKTCDPMSSPPPIRKHRSTSKGKPPVSSGALRLQQHPSMSSMHSRDSEGSFLDLDDLGPLESANKANDPDATLERLRKSVRDSHDLSFSPRQVTRDSLVANMLLSLDKLTLGQIHTPATSKTPFEEPSYGRAMSPTGEELSRSVPSGSRQGRMHSSVNHGHSYNYSSDLDETDDGSSRVSSQYSRGRRSNSSSQFRSNLGRINSLRESSQRGTATANGRVVQSRAGKTSRSSSTNSVDGNYAQVLGSQKISHGIGGRSSSFDLGHRPSLSSPTGNWKLDLDNTFFAEEHDAAPTPTIHGGPRRLALASRPTPQAPAQEADATESPVVERKRSLLSRGGTSGRAAPSKLESKYDMPPQLPALDLDSAPAPHVGYEKSKDKGLPVHDAPHPVQQTKEKERPSFFKKLFGSSKTLASAFESSSPHTSPITADNVERSNSKAHGHHNTNSMKSPSAPPSRGADSHHQQHHVVQKKSSFFRRRKKSVAEAPPVPQTHVPDPIDVGADRVKLIDKPEPSPVSSLRQIMSPYLKDLKGSEPNTPNKLLPPRRDRDSVSPEYDVEDKLDNHYRKSRGFSPDYEPAPNATIRAVKSQSALNTRAARDSYIPPTPRSQAPRSPSRFPPDVPAEKSKSRPDATFFEENSDTEADKLQKSRPRRRSDQPAHLVPPSSAPTKRSSRQSLREDRTRAEHSPKLLLQPTSSSEEEHHRESLGLPIQDSQGSSRTSSRHSNAPDRPATKPATSPISSPLDEPEVMVGQPTEDDRQKAKRIYDGSEDFIQKDRAAAWMGEEGLVRQRTLIAYMELYDFKDKSILSALRQICDRLILRAETQQIDRILVAFSKRWCECNPNHGFKAFDVIHTLCYSIMLLNTDLHLADLDQKMTRSQFVKNTMGTITQAVADSAPDAFERPSILPGKGGLLNPRDSDLNNSAEREREQKREWRSSFVPTMRSESRFGERSDELNDGCGPLVKAPFNGTMRAWEAQMEIVLKDIYASIRDEKLPLFGAAPEPEPPQQSTGLSVMGMLRRTPSVLSKAASEAAYSRGRMEGPSRPSTGRWTSKSRSRPRFHSNGFSSSRTSFEDGNSIWSPTMSSATWSRYSLGRTQTPYSMESLGSAYPGGDYQQSIGFANALSQAIIRDDGAGPSSQSVMSDDMSSAILLEDESLELSGAPWVKEGMVTHKHHLDGADKKAKDRNWTEVFAVIQKGTMSLFSFSTKSMRQKTKGVRKPAPGAVVGGGNWQDNATSLGTFSLRQTLASALPPPGYSRSRPHVWALSLPTGAVHLFQVGTPEISKEFVMTVNYWSARLSTHPLVGGISNIEYGWSDACVNNQLVTAINNESTLPPRPESAAANPGSRPPTHRRSASRQSSIRSSFDLGTTKAKTTLPGDRINISDWTPPTQSLRPSNAPEAEQLETLEKYVKSCEDDLQKHNQLRSPMLLAFTPRGHNATKAMANWERKSSYLLREIVKFRTYVDCLHYAQQRKKEVYDERDVAQRAARGDELSVSTASSVVQEDGDPLDITITEIA